MFRQLDIAPQRGLPAGMCLFVPSQCHQRMPQVERSFGKACVKGQGFLVVSNGVGRAAQPVRQPSGVVQQFGGGIAQFEKLLVESHGLLEVLALQSHRCQLTHGLRGLRRQVQSLLQGRLGKLPISHFGMGDSDVQPSVRRLLWEPQIRFEGVDGGGKIPKLRSPLGMR